MWIFFGHTNYTEKKVHRNNVDFSAMKIRSKKVRGKDGVFSLSKITSKKYVEMTLKFVEIWSSTYCSSVHIELTSIWRGGIVGFIPLS